MTLQGQGNSSAKQAEGCWPSVEAACEGPANNTASLPPLHSCHTPVLLSLFLAQLVAQETHRLLTCQESRSVYLGSQALACHLHPLFLLLGRLGPASCCCLCPSGVPGKAACCGPGVSVHSPVSPKVPFCPLAPTRFCKLLFEALVGNKPVTRSRAYCSLQEVLGVQSPRLSPTLLVQKPQVRVCFS